MFLPPQAGPLWEKIALGPNQPHTPWQTSERPHDSPPHGRDGLGGAPLGARPTEADLGGAPEAGVRSKAVLRPLAGGFRTRLTWPCGR